MSLKKLFPHLQSLRLESATVDTDKVTITVAVKRASARCPLCGCRSTRIHSHYRRTVADLPVSCRIVVLVVHVRRFRCLTPACPRRIFAERLPDLVAPYARKSVGLHQALERVGFAAGGEAGARLATALGMPTSPDTLLRAVRAASTPDAGSPSVVGIDDWSRRRGRRFGTIVVDLERHRSIDLLPDRNADSVAVWLTQHPTITAVARDRSDLYADGIARGVPQAVQVVDRFHVLKNLEEALERFLQHKRTAIDGAIAPADVPALPPQVVGASNRDRPPWEERAEEDSVRRHAPWVARYEQVVALRARQVDVADIARIVGISRQTVYRYLSLDSPPTRKHHATRRQTLLDPYKEYLLQRWDEGCHNAAQLWPEIRAKGFAYSYTNVSRFLAQQRPPMGQRPSIHRQLPANARPPTPRHVSFLLIRRPNDLTAKERVYIERLCQADAAIETAYALATDFAAMLRGRQGERLDAWIAAASESAIPDLRRFAAGLGADKKAVQAGLTLL